VEKAGRDMASIYGMIPKLNHFLNNARECKIPIISILTIRRDEDVSDPMQEIWIRHQVGSPICTAGSWGAEPISEIRIHVEDIVIEKKRYSAFFQTDLEAALKSRGIRTIIVTGTATNVCVETTCRDGFMRDYYVVVPEDLVACTDPNASQNALQNINRYFGTVTISDDILEVWYSE
jgi:ureidoacrylate peracid hydrolase